MQAQRNLITQRSFQNEYIEDIASLNPAISASGTMPLLCHQQPIEELNAFSDLVVFGTVIGRCTEAEYATENDGYPLEIAFLHVTGKLRGLDSFKLGSNIGIVQFDTDKVADTDIKIGNQVLVYLVEPSFEPSFVPNDVPVLSQVGGSGVFENGADLFSPRFKSMTKDSGQFRLGNGVSLAELSMAKVSTDPNRPWIIQRQGLFLQRADAARSPQFSTGPAKKLCDIPTS